MLFHMPSDALRKIRNIAWRSLFFALALCTRSTFAQIPEEPSLALSENQTSSAIIRVSALKTEHVAEPFGIETRQPRLSWLLESAARGQLQSAYRILAASSLEKLAANEADEWDSGKVPSDNFLEVPYAGRKLSSGQRIYWKVRIWDRNGRASAFSPPTFFEMGLLKKTDWGGKWIAAKTSISSPLFRRDFSINAPIHRARVYVSGLGCYELYLNGQKVGDRVLDPASTYYHNDQPFKLASRVLYSTYDVTNYLKDGTNVVGMMLGHGWYSAEAERLAPSWRSSYGDRPRLILQMNIELVDGRMFSVVSDSSWRASPGPIIYNDLFDGEAYDARMEQPGWNKSGFNDSAWNNASLADAPSGVLTAQLMPPERVVDTLQVLKMWASKVPEAFEQTNLYDFGQNFTGWVRLAVSGPRGTKLVLRYGARVYPEDSTLDTRSGETQPSTDGARQTDTYTLKGEGVEIWEPSFTLHGFRYVEIRGFTEASQVRSIEGRFVRSTVEPTGSFASSNELLNKIHHNIQWTIMSSLQGIPQDAAERAERAAWLGDPGFVAEDYIYNSDMLGFWEKWLQDIQDSQKEDGDTPWDAPPHVRGAYGVWPSWQSTYPLLAWYLYQYYGDRRVLEDHFSSLVKLISFQSAAAKNYSIPDEALGDHMEPQEDGYSRMQAQHTPTALTANAYYYNNVWLVAQIAEVLGRSGDAKSYLMLAQKIKEAFNSRFFDPTSNQYANGSQTANALALYFKLVPPEKISAVTRNLLNDIEKHDEHVTTGIIGTNAIVQVLPSHDAVSLMYRLATQTTYPSLGHQVMTGATTVCENYECSPWLSQNMKMFVSLDKFFYRNLAGISPESPGYRHVLIKPQPVEDLQTVTAQERTALGTVKVEWSRGSFVGRTRPFDLKVSIPAGVEATIAIPTFGSKNAHVLEGGVTVWKSNTYVPGTPGLTGASSKAGAIAFHAGSGSYHFVMNDGPETD